MKKNWSEVSQNNYHNHILEGLYKHFCIYDFMISRFFNSWTPCVETERGSIVK